jgi:hypothetical protein
VEETTATSSLSDSLLFFLPFLRWRLFLALFRLLEQLLLELLLELLLRLRFFFFLRLSRRELLSCEPSAGPVRCPALRTGNDYTVGEILCSQLLCRNCQSCCKIELELTRLELSS